MLHLLQIYIYATIFSGKANFKWYRQFYSTSMMKLKESLNLIFNRLLYAGKKCQDISIPCEVVDRASKIKWIVNIGNNDS